MALTSISGVVGSMPVVGLDDPRATDAHLVGTKAANLAKAARLGLPVLPGTVLTTEGCATLVPGWADDRDGLGGQLRAVWQQMSSGGRDSLVVRSSSSVEDTAASSMAGVFDSVLDVRTWDDFIEAVDAVVSSARHAPGGPAAMAVLVQPQLHPARGGVLFGADPMTGRRDHLVVAAVVGGPHHLVHGDVSGARYVLTARGRSLRREGDAEPVLSRADRRALAGLARATSQAFDAPQDVEWAIDRDGRLWLLQSRPITAMAATASRRSPIFGPGPVAETFPDPLAPLEEDLWVEPLRGGLAEAIVLGGLASRRQVRRSPLVVTVEGRVAVDLRLLGLGPRRRKFWTLLDPIPKLRRLGASWRVGRLRVALPDLVDDLVRQLDRDLGAVPALTKLSDETVLDVVVRSRQALVALHGYEVLAGMLLGPKSEAVTAASGALRLVAEARDGGLDDETIVANHPATLALVPPRIGGAPTLPPVPAVPPAEAIVEDPLAQRRETLRLRARWVQELGARAAGELGVRLTARRLLTSPGEVRFVDLAALAEAVRSGARPVSVQCDQRPSGPPLPAAFRLGDGARVVPVEQRRKAGGAGVGAGGGRSVGRVRHGEPVEVGEVLVVRTLDPGLASVLPRLGGLVAETGSVLSHLAILAREFGVPTVVDVPDALTRFPEGSAVSVDGTTGEVARLDEGAPEADVVDIR